MIGHRKNAVYPVILRGYGILLFLHQEILEWEEKGHPLDRQFFLLKLHRLDNYHLSHSILVYYLQLLVSSHFLMVQFIVSFAVGFLNSALRLNLFFLACFLIASFNRVFSF